MKLRLGFFILLVLLVTGCAGKTAQRQENGLGISLDEDDRIEKKSTYDPESYISSVRTLNETEVKSRSSQLLEQNPKDPIALNGLAYLHRKKGRLGIAEMLSRRVLASNPADLRARKNLAAIFWQKKEYNKALQEWLKILDRNSDLVDIHRNVASAYLKFGAFKAARKHLEVVIDSEKKSRSLMMAYARSLIGTGEFGSARKVLRDEIDDQGESALLRTLEGIEWVGVYLYTVESDRSLVADDRDLLQKLSKSLNTDMARRAQALLDSTGGASK